MALSSDSSLSVFVYVACFFLVVTMVPFDLIGCIFAVLSIFSTVSVHRFVVPVGFSLASKFMERWGRPRFPGEKSQEFP